jgi:glycosyltransferase involved in cell wall biosynthesis
VGESGMGRNSRQDLSQSPLSGKSIIIVGIVRNISTSINEDLKKLSEAFSNASTIDFFVAESGSSDNSLEVLAELSSQRNDFEYTTLKIDEKLSRTENMANARNAYLEYLRAESRLEQYSFVVIADFNKLNNKVTAASVESCFIRDDWEVVTSNQRGRYYDAWALRHPLWSPNDCWEQHEFFRKYTKFPESAITYSMRSRMLKIPSKSEWISVDSAFGGLAIYRAEILNSSALYSGIRSDGRKICEHVPFHFELQNNGARIYLNPAFINARTTDHSRRMSLAYTLFRVLKYPVNYFSRPK